MKDISKVRFETKLLLYVNLFKVKKLEFVILENEGELENRFSKQNR